MSITTDLQAGHRWKQYAKAGVAFLATTAAYWLLKTLGIGAAGIRR